MYRSNKLLLKPPPQHQQVAAMSKGELHIKRTLLENSLLMLIAASSTYQRAEAFHHQCFPTTAVIVPSETTNELQFNQPTSFKGCSLNKTSSASISPIIIMPFLENEDFSDYVSILLSTCGIAIAAHDGGVSDEKFEKWLRFVRRVFLLHSRATAQIRVSSQDRQQLAFQTFRVHDDVVIGLGCSDEEARNISMEYNADEKMAFECECFRKIAIWTVSRALSNGKFSTLTKQKPASVILPDENYDEDRPVEGAAEDCKALGKRRCGFVIDFLDLISPFVNATFRLRTARTFTGTVLQNGSATGLFEKVVNGENDLLAGFFYLNQWRMQALDIVTMDKTCTVIAAPYRRREAKKFSVLLAPFSTFVWVTLIGAGFAFTAASLILSRARGSGFLARYANASLYTLQVLAGQGLEQRAIKKFSGPQKFLFLFGTSASVVLTTVYLGQVTSLIASPQMNTPITTLDELKASGLPIKVGDYEGYWDYLFAPDGKLADFVTKWDKMKGMQYYGTPFVARGEAAFIESGAEMVAQKQLLEKESNLTGLTYPYEIKELEVCLELNWPGIVVPKRTRYGASLASYALKVRQAGIMERLQARYAPKGVPPEVTAEKHDMGAFSEVFIAYSILLSTCTVVFVIEVLLGVRERNAIQ